MVVGLTGGIGSGKTTVLSIFKSIGVPTYQADIEAKKIMVNSLEVKEKIIDLFGDEAYQNEQLNRNYISKVVFHNKKILQELNNIVHPAVHNHFKKFVREQQSPYLIYENAILYENKSENLCDKVIVVAADIETRINRVIKRDNIDRASVIARINNQWSQEDKIKKADYVVYNNDLKQLEVEVFNINEEILKSFKEDL